jgi:hypothetical protein
MKGENIIQEKYWVKVVIDCVEHCFVIRNF